MTTSDIRTALLAKKHKEYRRKVILVQAVVRRHRVQKEISRTIADQYNETVHRLLVAWDANRVPRLYRAIFLLVYSRITVSQLFLPYPPKTLP